ncbi:MAG: M16 family metallopeptidase [Vampirovibrionales bacterium]
MTDFPSRVPLQPLRPTQAIVSETEFPVHFLPHHGKRYRLANGHQVLVVPKAGTGFHVATWVRTGSIHEDDTNTGVSHFLEHLMFKGTPRFEAGVFDRAMESLGALINAATWKDFTYYYVTAPIGDTDTASTATAGNVHRVLDLHADMMLCASLPDEEIGPAYDPADTANPPASKRERSVVIEEIGMREDMPWSKLYTLLNESMYPEGHPYQREVIGTRQVVGLIPRASIEQYYRTWYDAASMMTLLVGPFTHEEGLQLVGQYFNFEARPESSVAPIARIHPETLVAPLPVKSPETRVVDHAEVSTRFGMLGYHGPKPEDLKASVSLDIVAQVLSEGRSARMTQELIEKAETPNFNTISAYQYSFRLGNVFLVSTNFLSEEVDTSMALLQSYMDALHHERPITEEEFTLALKRLKTSWASHAETAADIADALGSALVMNDSLESYERYPEVLATLTLTDVQETIHRYLQPAHAYQACLLPKASATPTPEALSLAG